MPRRSNRDKHIRHTSRQCHGFTRSDVMIVLVTILVGLMASIPIVASAKRQNAQTTSAANLMRINQGLVNYAADWNDRQVDWIPDDFGYYNDCNDYIQQRSCIPSLLLGWENRSSGSWALWGYWIDSVGQCSGVGTCGNASIIYPINFSIGFGSFRFINAKAFQPYVRRKFYAPVWYAQGDPTREEVSGVFNNENEFEALEGALIEFSTYCFSPAAMLHPDVLRAVPDGGYQSTDELPDSYVSPRTATCTTPDLKTRVLEHNWFRNSPSLKNPDTDQPWQFNQGLEASPVTLFFDGSIAELSTAQAWLDDLTVQAGTKGARGLWSRDTPLGANGYRGEDSVDGIAISHHILTTDGIKGRDILSRNGDRP